MKKVCVFLLFLTIPSLAFTMENETEDERKERFALFEKCLANGFFQSNEDDDLGFDSSDEEVEIYERKVPDKLTIAYVQANFYREFFADDFKTKTEIKELADFNNELDAYLKNKIYDKENSTKYILKKQRNSIEEALHLKGLILKEMSRRCNNAEQTALAEMFSDEKNKNDILRRSLNL